MLTTILTVLLIDKKVDAPIDEQELDAVRNYNYHPFSHNPRKSKPYENASRIVSTKKMTKSKKCKKSSKAPVMLQ
jgi:hypothetical protein